MPYLAASDARIGAASGTFFSAVETTPAAPMVTTVVNLAVKMLHV